MPDALTTQIVSASISITSLQNSVVQSGRGMVDVVCHLDAARRRQFLGSSCSTTEFTTDLVPRSQSVLLLIYQLDLESSSRQSYY